MITLVSSGNEPVDPASRTLRSLPIEDDGLGHAGDGGHLGGRREGGREEGREEIMIRPLGTYVVKGEG